MSFSELLDGMMKAHRVTNLQLADAVGVSESAVKKWRKGQASPSLDNVDRIALFFDKTLDEMSGNKRYKKNSERNNIPVIGSIRAGFPVESYQNIEDYVSLPTGVTYSENLFALKVVGDSMFPIVMEGDIVICQKGLRADGRICVVTVDNESTLKKIKLDTNGRGITLIPTNLMYPEMHYTASEANDKNITIDGVVIQMIRNF